MSHESVGGGSNKLAAKGWRGGCVAWVGRRGSDASERRDVRPPAVTQRSKSYPSANYANSYKSLQIWKVEILTVKR